MKKLVLLLLILSVCLLIFGCENELKDLEDDLGVNIPVIPKYKVTFNTNGGEPINSIETDRINTAPSARKQDHDFIGWYLDINCESPAVFPLDIEKNTTLYAKWIRVNYEATGSNFNIKMWNGSDASESFNITAPALDFDELKERGYYVTIILTYDVYYNKDYKLPFGYAGAPKYEITILDQNLVGFQEKNISASSSTKTKKYSWTQTADFFDDKSFSLTFSTDNIQNTIYFKNITIRYECVKGD